MRMAANRSGSFAVRLWATESDGGFSARWAAWALHLTLPVVLMVPAGTRAQDAEANLAPNPTFSQGADGRAAGWAFWGWAREGVKRTSTGTWDRQVGRTDSFSLRIVNASPTDVGTWDNRHSNTFIPVHAGRAYTVSAYLRVASADPVMRTNFRAGFCTLGEDGKPSYFGAEHRGGIKPDEARFPEADVWRRLAFAVFAPEGGTHLGMDIDLIGTGTGWIDDVRVTEGYDSDLLGDPPGPRISVKTAPDPDPPTPETPLAIILHVTNPFADRAMVLECEVLDYYFRPSVTRRDLVLKANEARYVTIPFAPEACARLFKVRTETDANRFQFTAVLRQKEREIASLRRTYTFKRRSRDWGTLPSLPPRRERIDDLFGEQTLVDVIHCADPEDPHPYFEGGRGLSSKTTGAVPQIEWKTLYRETSPHFTTIETLLGTRFRVTHGWGWFAYKFNRAGLKPHAPYLLVLEYPEDTGRTYTVFNNGMVCSLHGGYGFHTGRTLGDHWTRTLSSEYTDYPLSGKVERWLNLFHLAETTWAHGTAEKAGSFASGDAREGFWVVVGGIGPSQDPLAGGAAVRTIKLYELDSVSALFPHIEEPPLELGRRELLMTAEADGVSKFYHSLPPRADLWARSRVHDAQFLGVTGLVPNSWTKMPWDWLTTAVRDEDYALRIMPRVMIERDFLSRIGVPPEALAKSARGEAAGPVKSYRDSIELPDILHPATLDGALALITEILGPYTDVPQLAGMMLYRHFGESFPVSFSDYALALYERETGEAIQGEGAQSRRDWVLAQRKNEYYHWWYRKKRDFLLAVRDHLRSLRPDLSLYYFPWHSDDDFPFGVGRLRYVAPRLDSIYVPGTNILLVPGFTTPPEEWTPKQKAHPYLARDFYRERIAPHLEGKISIEDVLYGRYKDMPEFWGAPRNGERPHLRYPRDLDLVAMFTEPGGVYAHGVGFNPRLFREDAGLVYWAPVRHRFTADNPRFLDLFRTGEGSAVAVHMPYNEETSHANLATMHGAHGVEHGGPFCMMEEVLAMAHADPFHIMESMWEPLKRGFPHHARAFAQAYRALPAVPSEVLTGVVAPSDEGVVVRSYATDYGQYLAVVNPVFDRQRRQVRLTLAPAVSDVADVLDLGAQRSLPFTQLADGRVQIPLTLEPMSVTSLRIRDRVPRALFRDVRITPEAFSPNDDGVSDTATVTGRTVGQITAGRWQAEVRDGQDRVLRTFTGDVPDVRFVWDGADARGERCPDGVYHVCFAADTYPGRESRRQLTLDTIAPDVTPALDAERFQVTVNHVTVTGRVAGRLPPGAALLLRREGAADAVVAVLRDGSFTCAAEGLSIGDNALALVVRDRMGNCTAPQSITARFELDLRRPLNFDFGAGPIMDGFSAIRNETHFSEERGYGWIDYDVVWRGDRGVGDHLLRDYCSGKEDREWAVRLPNGEYRVEVIMVDMSFNHFTGDIYIEGERVLENRSITAGNPSRPVFDVVLNDGLLNVAQKNPGKLPYFALTGIIIEKRR